MSYYVRNVSVEQTILSELILRNKLRWSNPGIYSIANRYNSNWREPNWRGYQTPLIVMESSLRI